MFSSQSKKQIKIHRKFNLLILYSKLHLKLHNPITRKNCYPEIKQKKKNSKKLFCSIIYIYSFIYLQFTLIHLDTPLGLHH